MSARHDDNANTLWFMGTLVRIKLDGRRTDGRFALFEVTLPRGAAPPVHSHPQDETFHLIEGDVVAWVAEPGLAASADLSPSGWLSDGACRYGPGATIFAPAGTPHTFRVESDTARVLALSTPAGIEDYVRALAEPAQWPWLQPPLEGRRVSAERHEAVDREHGVVTYGPAPTSATGARDYAARPAGPGLPPPAEIDVAKMQHVGSRFSIEIVGPPLGASQ